MHSYCTCLVIHRHCRSGRCGNGVHTRCGVNRQLGKTGPLSGIDNNALCARDICSLDFFDKKGFRCIECTSGQDV